MLAASSDGRQQSEKEGTFEGACISKHHLKFCLHLQLETIQTRFYWNTKWNLLTRTQEFESTNWKISKTVWKRHIEGEPKVLFSLATWNYQGKISLKHQMEFADPRIRKYYLKYNQNSLKKWHWSYVYTWNLKLSEKDFLQLETIRERVHIHNKPGGHELEFADLNQNVLCGESLMRQI